VPGHPAHYRGGDLLAFLDRRFDRIRVIPVLAANEPEIENWACASEGLLKDAIIEIVIFFTPTG
jgi:hypothetical protein